MITLKKYCFHIVLALILVVSAIAFSVFKLMPSVWAIVLPNIVFMYLFWRFNAGKPVPVKYVVIALIFGLISIVGAAAGQVLIGVLLKPLFNTDMLGIFNSVFIAPLTEEALKGFVILWVYFQSKNNFGVTHGLVYAGLTGFTFAMGEQTLFSLTGNSEGIVTFWGHQYFISTIYFGLGHGVMTGFIGLACAKARLHNSVTIKRWLPWGGLLAAIIFHVIYNFAIVYDATHGDMVTPTIATIVYISMIIIFILLLGLIIKEYFTNSKQKIS